MKAATIIISLAAAAIVTWLSTASLMFLWVLGFWSVYPWPRRLWMWAVYAIDAPPNAIVHRWLLITGILAAMPLLLILCLVIACLSKRKAPEVYGKTGWATPKQMNNGGIASRDKPF
jgi:hypothetical protein